MSIVGEDDIDKVAKVTQYTDADIKLVEAKLGAASSVCNVFYLCNVLSCMLIITLHGI
jgi:hypothetical protein